MNHQEELFEELDATEEEVQKALQYYRKLKEQRQKYMQSPEAKERMKERYRKNMIRNMLYVVKAKEAGITVSDEEVEAVYKSKYGK